jgi:uncharacterized protein YkwD
MSARRTGHHKASRRIQLRPAAWAVPVVAALVAAGLYLSWPAGRAAPVTGARDTALTAGDCPSATTGAGRCARPPATTATAASPVQGQPGGATAGAAHHATAATRHRAPAGASQPPATPAPSSPAPSPPAPSPRATGTPAPAKGSRYDQAVNQVLALINQARAQAGLAAYTVSSGLVRSATAHNQVMAGGCGLSHQCPGEPPLGTRETDAGVHWTSAGENIGEAGPISATSAAIAQAAVGLTQDMLNEKPPDDGHRLNILSSSFHHIGIAVYLDSSGTVWMTQDFSN